jgi:hypothetical protein
MTSGDVCCGAPLAVRLYAGLPIIAAARPWIHLPCTPRPSRSPGAYWPSSGRLSWSMRSWPQEWGVPYIEQGCIRRGTQEGARIRVR